MSLFGDLDDDTVGYIFTQFVKDKDFITLAYVIRTDRRFRKTINETNY